MSMQNTITIITTIEPVDSKGRRKVTVSAAPEGEMIIIKTGLFPDRHKLADECLVEVGTRKPQTVKAAAAKPAAKKKAGGKAEADDESEAETGPIGPTEETPEAEATAARHADLMDESAARQEAKERDEDLPEIEGDDESIEEDDDNG